jgi:hypothetical protein
VHVLLSLCVGVWVSGTQTAASSQALQHDSNSNQRAVITVSPPRTPAPTHGLVARSFCPGMPCLAAGGGVDAMTSLSAWAQSDWGKMPACYAVAHGSSPARARAMSGCFFKVPGGSGWNRKFRRLSRLELPCAD